MWQDNLLVTDKSNLRRCEKKSPAVVKKAGGGVGFPIKHVRLSTGIDFRFPPKPYLHKVIKETKMHSSERMGEEAPVNEGGQQSWRGQECKEEYSLP